MFGLGPTQVQRPGEGQQHFVGGVAGLALFETDVVGDGHPGEVGGLFTTQAGHSAAFSPVLDPGPGGRDGGATRRRSYDRVFDTYGADASEAIDDGGRYATIATQAGPAPDLTARNITTELCQVGADGETLRRLVGLVDKGVISPRVDSVFSIVDVVRAHRHFAAGRVRGKVALVFQSQAPHSQQA